MNKPDENDFFAESRGEDALTVEDQDAVELTAQLVRTQSLPAGILELASIPTVFDLPARLRERADGLHVLRDTGSWVRVMSGYLRPLALVRDAMSNRILKRLVAIAPLPTTLTERPRWRLVALDNNEVTNVSKFKERVVESTCRFLTASERDLAELFAHEGRLPSLQLCERFGRLASETVPVFIYCNAVVSDGTIERRNFDIDPIFQCAGTRYFLDESLPRDNGPQLAAVEQEPSNADVRTLLITVYRFWRIQGLLGLGWAVAGLARPALMARVAAFPLLDAVGTRQTGKTTLLQVIASMFGSETLSTAIEVNSVAATRRHLANISGLPLTFDDLQPDAARKLISILLASFDGRRSMLATPSNRNRTVDFIPRANVMISNESLPDHAAFLSRCAALQMVPVSEEKRRQFNQSDTFLNAKRAGLYILSRFTTALESEIVKRSQDLAHDLRGIGERGARQVWGIVLAGLECALGLAHVSDRDTVRMLSEGRELATTTVRTLTGLGWATVMFEDLVPMIGTEQFPGKFFDLDEKEQRLWFAHAQLFHVWAEARRRGNRTPPVGLKDIRRELTEMPWVIGKGTKHRFGLTTVAAMAVNLNSEHPEAIRDILHHLRSRVP
ncbi:MAG: hypothetical protein IT462_14305 [Planctomycetes bacterium]|nr:hypothetical protein [Planctomycetota bacterium]